MKHPARYLAYKLASLFDLPDQWAEEAQRFIEHDLARHSLDQVEASWVRRLT